MSTLCYHSSIYLYNWDAWGTKFVSLNVHQAIHRNSENIEPSNIDDGILFDRWDIHKIKKGNLSPLSKRLYTNILSLIVMSKFKDVACSPWCSSFCSNYLGWIAWSRHIFIDVLWNLEAWRESLDIHSWTYMNSKKCKTRLAQYGAGFMSIGMPISSLNANFPMVITFYEDKWYGINQSLFLQDTDA